MTFLRIVIGNNTNYGTVRFAIEDIPAISVFSRTTTAASITATRPIRAASTCSTAPITTSISFLVPKGRDEEKLKYHMDWVRLRDEYA
jgi:predicted dithiol-disulfide oxidoreductase (DUF899 family)